MKALYLGILKGCSEQLLVSENVPQSQRVQDHTRYQPSGTTSVSEAAPGRIRNLEQASELGSLNVSLDELTLQSCGLSRNMGIPFERSYNRPD